MIYFYVLDFNRGGVYKFIDTSFCGFEDLCNYDKQVEILKKWGFKEDECNWMITQDDEDIQFITEPLKK